MAASVPFATLKMGWNPAIGAIDLVIDPTGNGKGRLSIDRTPATPILIALLSDRRADPDDVLPPDLTPGLVGQDDGLFAWRGWVGDPLLPDGQRLGSKFWLRARDIQTDANRVLVEDDADTALADIASYHGIPITNVATLQADDVIGVQTTVGSLSITTTVPSL